MPISSRIKTLMIVIILLIIAGVLFLVFSSASKIALPQPVLINTNNQPTMGNVNAKLHIVAFEDLKCSNCMRYNETILPKIDAQYVKTGQASYTIITLAFIPGSLPAANAAQCVYAQNHHAFFDYVAYIYAHQPPEEQDWATIPNLMLFASHIAGINTDTLANCLVASPYAALIGNNLFIASAAMGSNVATPALYVNGIKVDPLNWEHVQQIIHQLQ